jgi:hypothetical protein
LAKFIKNFWVFFFDFLGIPGIFPNPKRSHLSTLYRLDRGLYKDAGAKIRYRAGYLEALNNQIVYCAFKNIFNTTWFTR